MRVSNDFDPAAEDFEFPLSIPDQHSLMNSVGKPKHNHLENVNGVQLVGGRNPQEMLIAQQPYMNPTNYNMQNPNPLPQGTFQSHAYETYHKPANYIMYGRGSPAMHPIQRAKAGSFSPNKKQKYGSFI